MNIGIYIGGTPNREIDCRNIIENGNPGIGGTEYEFVMLATYLARHAAASDINLSIFQSGRYRLHDDIPTINGVGQSELLNSAKSRDIDILIIDSRLPLNLIKSFNGSGIKLIVWCHCIGSLYRHLLYARWDAVKSVVFVSRGHYLNYIDNPVARKSTFAFNAVSINENIHALRGRVPYDKRPHDVVFMGALDESKGFHVLAKAWPDVLKKVPDARLHVIGSANLYGGNFRLGPLGIADERYEKRFGSYLSTPDGRLHPSIVLHGQLGEEKYDVMSECRVGVPNPDGATETFCICAVEMQLCGCRAVTKWSSGYLDTVPPPNIMVDNSSQLASAIASALTDDEFRCDENIDNIKTNFAIEAVGQKWPTIIKSVYIDSKITDEVVVPGKFRLREINASLRKWLPILPPLGLVRDTMSRFIGVVCRVVKR